MGSPFSFVPTKKPIKDNNISNTATDISCTDNSSCKKNPIDNKNHLILHLHHQPE
jgi:hypothetical protein